MHVAEIVAIMFGDSPGCLRFEPEPPAAAAPPPAASLTNPPPMERPASAPSSLPVLALHVLDALPDPPDTFTADDVRDALAAMHGEPDLDGAACSTRSPVTNS